jgi:SpoVK/Ycf46/Vps4 family AAA+-type ATPase
MDLIKSVQKGLVGTSIELPGIAVIMFGATNIPEAIDAALKRPGRFDNTIEVGNPGARDREKIAQLYLQQYPCYPDVEAKRFAVVTDGMTPADIKAVFGEAASDAGSKRQKLLKIANFCTALFNAKTEKRFDNYERRVLEILINMYPCDPTVTDEIIVQGLMYSTTQRIANIFDNAYEKIKMEKISKDIQQKIGEEGVNAKPFISFDDLKSVASAPEQKEEVPGDLTEKLLNLPEPERFSE